MLGRLIQLEVWFFIVPTIYVGYRLFLQIYVTIFQGQGAVLSRILFALIAFSRLSDRLKTHALSKHFMEKISY